MGAPPQISSTTFESLSQVKLRRAARRRLWRAAQACGAGPPQARGAGPPQARGAGPPQGRGHERAPRARAPRFSLRSIFTFLRLMIVLLFVCTTDPVAHLLAKLWLDVLHLVGRCQKLQVPGSIEQTSACNWIKVVSQHIDPFDQCGMRFLERLQSLLTDLCLAMILERSLLVISTVACSYNPWPEPD